MKPASFDEGLIVGAAAHSLTRARELCPLYAGDAAPLHDEQVADIIRQAGAMIHTFAFASTAGAIGMAVAGKPQIAFNSNATAAQRSLGVRHELRHLLEEEIHNPVGPVFMSDTGYMSHAERAADLFALADLIPAWTLRRCRSGKETAGEVLQAAAEYGEPWGDLWTADRARLRLLLFRDCGI